MNRRSFLAIPATLAAAPRTREIPAAVLEDKIQGGLLGQLIGDLNGLLHEMKYLAEPGDARDYTPSLPDGAWTDDDTDIDNGASTIAALLYGDGAFVPTLRAAFNLGWDADNNAAAAGTVLGVIKGARWFASQGWTIKDRYRNTSRDQVPEDETITRYGDRLIAVARKNIVEGGGAVMKSAYRIPVEDPANVELLPDPDPDRRRGALAAQLRPAIDRDLASPDPVRQARAAYLAICLDLASGLKQRRPEPWASAVRALAAQSGVVQAIFREAPFLAGDLLRDRARAAGIQSP